ncbi:unnamed protein product [Oncorhynchus mykiss]|uniref:Uncharacterized protein n=1 Tax=Oncorhynchus mykiss TaxID=8022 RepID=A0A060Z2T3_ONCMY|nr:unnamed protein product [Oncorhynchus mykiss]
MNRRTRVEGMWLGGEDFNQKGSFIHKPSQGWLHPDKKITGPGASYIVRVSNHTYSPSTALCITQMLLSFSIPLSISALHFLRVVFLAVKYCIYPR